MRGFGPAPFRMNGLFGESNGSIHKAAGRGLPVTQEIALSVRGNQVECVVNEKTVAHFDNSSLIRLGKLKSTDGYCGIRFAHNTDVPVSGLAM